MTTAKRKHDRIVFGSCNSQHREQVLWSDVASRDAAAFVWGGDAVYADDFEPVSVAGLPASWSAALPFFKRPSAATPERLRELYDRQLRHPGYRSLLERRDSAVVLGAMDDHDYGQNNGDATYEHRADSGRLFVDFLQRSSPETDLSLWMSRAAAGKGVYGVKVLDFTKPAGRELLSDRQAGIDPDCCLDSRDNDNDNADNNATTEEPFLLSERSVAVFVLDCRSNKTPWPASRFRVDDAADFLGQEQWDWFETALSRSTAAANIIVQGLQVSADRFFDGNLVEDWSRFPAAQERLYQTVLQSNCSSPVLVSGDVHMAELLRRDCRRMPKLQQQQQQQEVVEPTTRMILEMTVSGMTHSWGTRVCARPGSSVTCRTGVADSALKMGMHLAHSKHLAWTDVVNLPRRRQQSSLQQSLKNEEEEEMTTTVNRGKRGVQYSLELNFGEIEFDWDRNRVVVRVLGTNGAVLLDTEWDMDLLSGLTEPPPPPDISTGGGQLTTADFALAASERRRRRRRRITTSSSSSSIHPTVGGGVDTTKEEEDDDEEWICLPYRGTPSVALKLFTVLAPVTLSASIMFVPVAIPVVLATMILLKRRRRHF